MKRPNWKTDLVRERQLSELKTWNIASVVKAIVCARAKLALRSTRLNIHSVPTAMNIATNRIFCNISRLMIPISGSRGDSSITSPSFGSIAKVMSKIPSVTRFTHRICTGEMISPFAANKTSELSSVISSPMLVASRNLTTLRTFWKTTRPSSTALTMLAKLSSVSTISAVSLVTSVPVMPIATPICAAWSAGASFTPSPVIATTWPCCCNLSTMRCLCSGATRAKTETLSSAASNSSSLRCATSPPVIASPPSSKMPTSRAMAAPVIL